MNRLRPSVRLFLWTMAVLALLWVGVGDRLLTHWAYAVERGRLQAGADQLASPDELAGLQTISKAFRTVAKVARPGVVHIEVSGGRRLSGMTDEMVDQIARQFGISPEQARELLRKLDPGAGSGIIFDADGYILTNNHVVEGRDTITVHLADERTCEATLVGSDPKTDLAVIKVNVGELHALRIGDSDKVEVGDWVVAVGAPFGLSQTVTHGIVSATGRSRVKDINIQYQNFIQTDAAINPGNSGGPLLNLRGEVIGVNTAIATHGDSNAGVAFTIPSNMALKVAKQLIATGAVARGWLGVSMRVEPLTDDLVKIFELPNRYGVLLERILAKSPAEKAGLQVEDVIVAVNGERVRGAEYFRSIIADLGPNEDATIRLIRDGQPKDLKVRLALQPTNLLTASSGEATWYRRIPALGSTAGLTLRPGLPEIEVLPAMVRTMARAYDETDRGVLILALDDYVPGINQLKAGEVIVGVEGKMVNNVGELLAAFEAARGKKRVRLQVIEPTGDRKIIHVSTRP